jgi:hypothetical protein
VKLPNSAGTIRAWVVYPERKDKAPVVIVIHEIFGLTDWILRWPTSWPMTDSSQSRPTFSPAKALTGVTAIRSPVATR